jgi:dihydroorotate dehydrogenase electron transfer subunit
LIPSPGQYLLAGAASQTDLLPVPLFSTESSLQGFIASAPIPPTWKPGTEIYLRGPLGSGFLLPVSVRKVALIAFDGNASRLRGLIRPALQQGGAIVLASDSEIGNLPDEVEIQPLSAMRDILDWADYSIFDVMRENLPVLCEKLLGVSQPSVKKKAQVLVGTPIPCGGIADCGVCAVNTKSSWMLACEDGPVFDLREFV